MKGGRGGPLCPPAFARPSSCALRRTLCRFPKHLKQILENALLIAVPYRTDQRHALPLNPGHIGRVTGSRCAKEVGQTNSEIGGELVESEYDDFGTLQISGLELVRDQAVPLVSIQNGPLCPVVWNDCESEIVAALDEAGQKAG